MTIPWDISLEHEKFERRSPLPPMRKRKKKVSIRTKQEIE
jgi:hypothetical protein